VANFFKHTKLTPQVILLMLKPKVFGLMYHLKYILGAKTIYQKTSLIAMHYINGEKIWLCTWSLLIFCGFVL